MSYRLALGVLSFFLVVGGPAFPQAQDSPQPSGASGEIPSFLLEDEEFGVEEGVWSDEFEDGKPSSAWFVYDPGYFANIDVAAQRDPRIPHEELTLYDEPIGAEEVEGLLSIPGSLPPPGAAPEAATVYDPNDMRRYKVITPDPVRGAFRAELKIALRGRTFGLAHLIFYVREHDWKFDGARQATLVAYLMNPPDQPTQVGYAANWDQVEYFDPNLRFLGIEAEDFITIQLRRTEDNQIQFWTAEDDADLEYRGRLGAPIETDLADILIGVNCTGGGGEEQIEGAVTLDSFSIRGPEVPDVEEGTENQTLLDLRETLRAEYEIDTQGRFDYSEAGLAANRAFTWMHFYGTTVRYPPILLPPIPPDIQQFEIPPPGVEVPAEAKPFLEALLNTQPFLRGDSRYLAQANEKYREAADADPLYTSIHKQVQWVNDVALQRVIRLLGVFRARTGNAPRTGGLVQQGLQVIKADYDIYVGEDSGRNEWDPPIVIFEGRLSPEAKAQTLALPDQVAYAFLQQYFGLQAEIQRPVDLIGRIPFLFDPDWMTIPLTLYVPDISQLVLARLVSQAGALTAGVSQAGGPLGGVGAGQLNFASFQSLSSLFGGLDPTLMMGRGYTVVEYYGARYGISDQIIRDDMGRVKPKETAERAFPWLRDFPGLVDIIAEIIDPDQHGSAVVEWNFDFSQFHTIPTVPRNNIRPESLQPPESLYVDSEVPLLVNIDNPDIPRRYTLADYFGWELGPEGLFREPELPNHIAAFDSPSLPLSTTNVQ